MKLIMHPIIGRNNTLNLWVETLESKSHSMSWNKSSIFFCVNMSFILQTATMMKRSCQNPIKWLFWYQHIKILTIGEPFYSWLWMNGTKHHLDREVPHLFFLRFFCPFLHHKLIVVHPKPKSKAYKFLSNFTCGILSNKYKKNKGFFSHTMTHPHVSANDGTWVVYAMTSAPEKKKKNSVVSV